MSRPAEPLDLLASKTRFRRRLLRWFRKEGRDLPWRQTRDPYAILVSEFMLQQTQVASVIPYYQRWLKRFPTFQDLARSSEADVLHAWQGLGYYSRARNLQAAARSVAKTFGGRLPANRAEIECLPGIGRYTAGAVACFAFDLPEPMVEANIARVLTRLTNSRRPIDLASGRTFLWEIADALLPRTNAREHNSALMDLGAMICRPRRPLCAACPVLSFCRAQKPEHLPRKRKRPSLRSLTERHAYIRDRNLVLLEQSQTRWRGMWILPRLTRRGAVSPLLSLDFPFTHHRIRLEVFPGAPPPRPNEHSKWFTHRALERLPIPTPHRRALARLLPARHFLSDP